MRTAMATLLLVLSPALLAQKDEVSRSWNQPVEPFRIAGNLYYVGASDITSFLITTPEGHIVLDGGFEETAPQIRRNIETLGFKVSDVKILLSSHGHSDHAGGLAELKRATGATLYASEPEVPLLTRGGLDDPMFGDRFQFPPVIPDRIIADRGTVSLGGVSMTARITPGHTRGCTTWTTTVREGAKKYDVVFLCSPTVPGYQLVNNERYPEVIDDYRKHFRILKTLRPDIPLAAHGNFFDLADKIKRRGGATNPFIDPDGYRKLVARFEKRFESIVAEQSKR
jgi:metallo-beta-lactamase class B